MSPTEPLSRRNIFGQNLLTGDYVLPESTTWLFEIGKAGQKSIFKIGKKYTK